MKTMVLVVLAATVLPVFGNGGGFFRGGVGRTGDIELFEPSGVDQVRILTETLTVEFGKEEARVEVRYQMRNVTDRKAKVRFGFPVEELFDDDFMGAGNGIAKPPADSPQYCRDYELTVGGKTVKAKWRGEKKGADARTRGIAGWLVSEAGFSAGEEKPVTIRFRSAYPKEVWSVSENGRISPRLFKYRLSTAACWAGSIGKGSIVLRPAGIPLDDLRVLKPVNRFQKKGDDWVWNFEDLEPTLADDLEIQVSPAVNTYGQSLDERGGNEPGNHVTYIERGGRWTMAHANYEVTASSTLPDDGQLSYAAGNVQSTWNDLAWSEGAAGPGVGEWLLLEPKVAKPLTGIEIQPGYAKSEELFQANARPKRLRVELNGEHRFHADIPDSKELFEIPVKDYSRPVKSVKLVVEEVWKGGKYEDLCISGVILQARLGRKPEIRPSR
jgi:hypothetical protein